jgi:hypothetical protein
VTEFPAFICSHVFEDSRPILLVVNSDGEWQFLCGEAHADIPLVVGINHLLHRDPTLREVLDLAENWEAERDRPNAPWQRRPWSEQDG